MKKKNLMLAVVAGLFVVGVASAGTPDATGGVITFTGTVTAETCTVSVNGAGASTTVALPGIAASSLPTVGTWGMRTPFNIALTSCGAASGSPAAMVSAYFEPDVGVDLFTGNLLNTQVGVSAATNVEVALLSGANVGTSPFTPLLVGGVNSVNVPQVAISGGAATLNYYAEYMNEPGLIADSQGVLNNAQGTPGAATPGAVLASVSYTLAYQ